jgi:hypothetical protein
MNWSNGFHRMNGILLAYGPRIQRGTQVQRATMVDIAPTVLYDLGLPVPTNMDGRVLMDLLDPGHVRANPICHEAPLTQAGAAVRTGHTEDEQAQVAGRLAGLGYIE